MAKRAGNMSGSRAGSKSARPSRGAPKEQPEGTRTLAKSADPEYVKFTTYIRKTTHVGVKTRLVSRGKELSDLVEELMSKWLKENGSSTT